MSIRKTTQNFIAFSLLLLPLSAAAQAPAAETVAAGPRTIYAITVPLTPDAPATLWRLTPCDAAPAAEAETVPSLQGLPALQGLPTLPSLPTLPTLPALPAVPGLPAPPALQETTWCATPVPSQAREWLRTILEMYPTPEREE